MTDNASDHELIERELIRAAAGLPSASSVGPIFILGAPRTGSTIFYQSLIARFRLAYISNLTNTFYPQQPLIGLAIQHAFPCYDSISPNSRYGKTEGLLQPSEGSAVLAHWFGGGHPSEVVSADFIPGRETHFATTMMVAASMFRRPLVIKNAWNCFRIGALARACPTASFIWVRRDIVSSALSDLAARYAVQKSPYTWNSATPRNWEALRKRPYWEQVVENQAAFSAAIMRAAARLGTRRFLEIWYEDLIRNPDEQLERLATDCNALAICDRGPLLAISSGDGSARDLPARDRQELLGFIEANADRFRPLRYAGPERARGPFPAHLADSKSEQS